MRSSSDRGQETVIIGMDVDLAEVEAAMEWYEETFLRRACTGAEREHQVRDGGLKQWTSGNRRRVEMGWKLVIAAVGVFGVAVSGVEWARRAESASAHRAVFGSAGAYFDSSTPQNQTDQAARSETITGLVGRLELERYKATIKGLTQFGDRRQGTDRNRKAVDWIEAQLKSYGCTNTERLKYDYEPGPPRTPRTPPAGQTAVAAGGGRPRGNRIPTGVNTDPSKQPDLELRALDSEASTPGPREEVYCTKIGTTDPEEMYIIGGHMDGIGWGEAANDDGSGTALVMEVARVLSSPDVRTERSVRFVLWNNEETGLNGSQAYVQQRQSFQGKEDPPGSGRYPEPKWLGMITHDMMLFDHGMPRADGTMSKEQRPEADINVEFQVNSKFAAESEALAWVLERADENYAADYPASVSSHMTNTDSSSFMDVVPSLSVRENERGTQIGNGWDPQWHQPTDLYKTYSDADFRLGLNATQTTLAAVAALAGATVEKK